MLLLNWLSGFWTKSNQLAATKRPLRRLELMRLESRRVLNADVQIFGLDVPDDASVTDDAPLESGAEDASHDSTFDVVAADYSEAFDAVTPGELPNSDEAAPSDADLAAQLDQATLDDVAAVAESDSTLVPADLPQPVSGHDVTTFDLTATFATNTVDDTSDSSAEFDSTFDTLADQDLSSGDSPMRMSGDDSDQHTSAIDLSNIGPDHNAANSTDSSESGGTDSSAKATADDADVLDDSSDDVSDELTTVARGETTIVDADEVVVTQTTTINGTLVAPLGVEVDDGGELKGSGTIEGDVTLLPGGTLSPGNSPGIMNVNNLTLMAGGTVNIDVVPSYQTAGVHFDQFNVTGSVDLGGATLNLVGGTSAPGHGQILTIIKNDGVDGVIGTFAGLAEGSLVSVGLFSATISYQGGDGNDVTLTTDFSSSGPLTVAGTALADLLQIRLVGNVVQTLNGSTVTSETLLAGLSSLTIIGNGGGDQLTVNYADDATSDGFFDLPITFNGGSPTTMPGDKLIISGDAGTGSFTAITHNFTNSHDGSINIDGTVITYTGLEPITDNLNATNRIFTFNGGTETITLTDAAGTNMTIDSTLGESVTFANPTTSITINAGSGNDNVILSSVDAAYAGSLTVDGQAGNDTLTGPNQNVNWDVDAGTFTGMSFIASFTSVETLQGGSGIDSFDVSVSPATAFVLRGGAGADEFVIDAALPGASSVNGEAGSDTLRGTQIDAAVITIVGAGAGAGVDGTEASVGTGGWNDIDTIIGNGMGSLTGRTVTTVWNLNAPPTLSTYVAAGFTLRFSGFSTLLGGGQTDTFNILGDYGNVTINGNLGVDDVNINSNLTATAVSFTAETIDVGAVTVLTTGNQIYNGPLSLSSSTLNSTGGSIVLGGNVSVLGSAGSTIAGMLDLGGVTRTFTVADTPAGVDLLINAAISNGGVTKLGAGTMTLSGANTYTGTTTINAGTLRLGANEVLPGDVAIGSSGRLDLAGFDESVDSLTGNGRVTNTLGGSSTFFVGDNNASSVFAGIIENASGMVSLRKVGTGTLTLTGASTYSGDTTIDDGTLKLGFGDILPDGVGKGNVIINASGVLDLNGFDEDINGLSGTGTVDNLTGIGIYVLSVGAANVSSTFDGVIQDTSGRVALTKTGTGTFTLTGANLYSGVTTVQSGTLQVTGSTDAASAVTVKNGGTLAGNDGATAGDVGGTVLVETGGQLSPGLTVGTLATGSVTLSSGSQYLVNVNGDVLAGTDYDQLQVTGTVNLGNATLNVTGTISPPTGAQIVLIDNDGVDSVSGTFAGLAQGSIVLINGFSFQIRYNGGDGNDVVLQAADTLVSLVAGNLTVTDINSVTNDTLTIWSNSGFGRFEIFDPLRTVVSNIAGAISFDIHTVYVPFSAVTGTAINVLTGDGSDTLTIDFSKGNFGKALTYTGGNPLVSVGDALVLTGGGPFASVTHTLTSDTAGTVNITGNSLITYSEIEESISDNLAATARTFNYNGGAETITLTDAAGVGLNTIDSTLGAAVTFTNPTASLTINAGSGNDSVNINSIDAAYRAALTVNGDSSTDTITLNTALTLGSASSIGAVSLTAETIDLNAAIDTTAVTTGAIGLSGTTVSTNSNLSTDGAAVTIAATTAFNVDSSVTIDTKLGAGGTAGAINFAGTGRISATASGFDLNLRTDTAGGTGGAINLATINGDSGAFLNDLLVDSRGATNGSILLLGNISVDDDGVNPGTITLAGNVLLNGTRTLDSEQGNTANGGIVNLQNAVFGATVGGVGLIINADTAAGGATGGTVTLGSFEPPAGTNRIGALTVSTNGATKGQINVPVAVQTAGAITFQNANVVDIDADVTAGQGLTISDVTTRVDLAAGVDLSAVAGVTIATNVAEIRLSGANGSANSIVTTSDANPASNITLAAIVATNNDVDLTVSSQRNVTLDTVDLKTTGTLTINVDSDNDTASSTLTANALSAGTIVLDGGNSRDDDATLNGTVTSNSGSITMTDFRVLDVNFDVAAATTLTISGVSTRVDLGDNVDLTAGGNLSVTTNVASILLSGANGTANVIDANGDGNVSLGPVTTTNADVDLTVNAQGNITLTSVNLQTDGTLTLNVDDNGNGTNTLTAGALTAGTLNVLGGADCNDAVILNGTSVVTNNVSITSVGSIDQNGTLTAGGSVTYTACDFINIDGALSSTNGAALPITLTTTVGNINVNAAVTTTTGNIDVNSGAAFTLANNITISSASGNITVDTTGANALTVNGNITTGGAGTIALTGSAAITQDATSLIQTANGLITLTAAGAITVDVIESTGGANISLTAGTSISEADNTARIGAVGTSSLLTLTAGTNIGGSGTAAINTSVGTLNAATTNGSIFIAEADGLTLNVVTANGAGNDVIVTSTTGNILVNSVTAPDTIQLTATGGAIEESGADGTADLIAATLDLDALNGIGAAGAIELSATTISADSSATGAGNVNLNSLSNGTTGAVTFTSLTAGTGNITVDQTGGQTLTITNGSTATDGSIAISNAGANLTATMITARGNGDVTLTTTTAGDVRVGLVTAADDLITINSAAGIEESGTDPATDLVAGTLDLNAVTGIGDDATLEVTAASIAADSTGTGKIDIDSLATAGVTFTSLTTGTGSITVDQTGNQTLTIASSSTTDGAISISNVNANLTVTTMTAGGVGRNVTLTTTTGGDVLVDSVTAAGDLITINSAAGIEEVTPGDVGADLVAATLDLNAVNGIGDDATLEVTATMITADSTGTGNVDLDSLATTAVTFTTLTAGTGSITVDQTGGQSLTITTSTTVDGAIAISNSSGSLTAATITAAGTGRNVTLITTTSGDVFVGSVTAAGDQITINSASAIEELGSDTAADLTAATLDLDAVSGIGHAAVIELAASSIAADNTDAFDVRLSNSLGTAVTVTSLTTASSSLTTGGNIDFAQSGAAVTFTGPVTSGTAGIGGGNITLTSNGGLTIAATGFVSSEQGVGGTLSINGATINGAITVGAGNVTINGGGDDVIIDANITVSNDVSFTATDDIIIRATVTTSGAGSDITLNADSDNNGLGGVWLDEAGSAKNAQLASSGDIIVSGSDLSTLVTDARTTRDAIRIDNDGANQQLDAVGTITLTGKVIGGANPTSASDIILDGRTNAGVSLVANAADAIYVCADQTAADDLTFQDAVIITANVTFTAGGAAGNDVLFAETINDDGVVGTQSNVTVNAGGETRFNGSVGNTSRLTSLTTDVSGTVVLNAAQFRTTGDLMLHDEVQIQTTTALDSSGGNVTIDNNITFMTDGADLSVTTAGGNVNLLGSVNAETTSARGEDITITAGTGNVTLGRVGMGDAFGSNGAATDRLGTIRVISAANVTVEATIGAGRFQQDVGSGTTTFNAAIDLDNGAAGTVLQLTNVKNVVFADAATVTTANSGSASLDGDTTGTLTIGDGNWSLDGAFAEQEFVSVSLAANIVTTGDSITFNNPLTLTDNVLLDTTNGNAVPTGANISLNTVNGSSANNDLTLNAGSGGDISASTVGVTNAVGSVTITNAHNVTFTSTIRATGDVIQQAGTGTTTFNGTAGTGIGGELDVTTNAVTFNTADMLTVGDVTVTAQNAITLNAGAGINATAAMITLLANQDGAGTEGFSQNSTAVIRTTNETATAVSITVNTAGGGTGNAAISDIRAGTTSGQITINANGGAITDNLTGEATNLTAFRADLTAATGIGSADDIDTNLSQVQFTNTTSGAVQIQEVAGAGDNALEVLSGSNVTGNIDVRTTDGNLTISGAVSTTTVGTVTLLAGDSDNDGNGDLIVNAAVTTATGQVTLTSSGNDVTFGAAGDVTTSGGKIEVNSGVTGSGLIAMNDGTLFNAGAGLIDLNGVGDVTLGQLVTTNGTTSAITIDSTAGAIIDAGDANNGIGTTADVVAMSGGIVLNGATGIGALDAIETSAATISAINSGSADVRLANSLATPVTVTSLRTTTATGLTGGSIDFAQTGGGAVTFTGQVTSGRTGVNGGSITLTSTGNLTVDTASTVDSSVGTGGTLTISGATINGTVTVGAGNVTINGGGDDVIIGGNISASNDITLTATDDVIIRGGVTATGSTSDISVEADSDNNGLGGVWLDDTTPSPNNAKLDAGGNIGVTGSDLSTAVVDTRTTFDAIRIDADGTNLQLSAGGAITLTGKVLAGANPTTNSDIIFDGRTSAGTSLVVDADDAIYLCANQTAGDDITFQDAVIVTADITLTAGSAAGNDVLFAETVNDDGNGGTTSNVTINAGGTTRFNGSVGNTSRLTSLTTNAAGTTVLNGAVFQTTGNVSFNDAVVLEQAVTVDSSSGNVLFGSTVNDDGSGVTASDLLVNSTAETRFNGSVGTTSRLTSLTTNAGGTTVLNAADFRTTGNMTFNDNVSVPFTPTTTLDLTTGDLLFGGTVTASGNLTISNADDVTFASTIQAVGNVTQTAGTGTTAFNGTAGGGIGGTLNVTTNAVTFSSADVLTVGNVTVTAQNGITLNAGAGINATAATITLSANQDGAGTQGFTQNSTAVIRTTNDTASAVSITVNTAGSGTGTAAISDIRAGTATAGRITINANGGAITDNLSGEAANLTAFRADLTAATGIGSADDIDTNLSQVQFTNATGGAVQIQEVAGAGDNALEVLSGSNVTGNIDVRTTDGNLTISGAVATTSAGTITLVAGDSDNDGNGDLIVNAAITAASGQVTLTSAGNDVNFGANGDVTTTTGDLQVNAGVTGVGKITMNDATLFNTGSGLIDLNGVGDVTLGQLVTTNATGAAVSIDSTSGAVIDAGDADNGPGTADIIANSGTVNINAGMSIGSAGAGAIDTRIATLNATTTNGSIFIAEEDGLTLNTVTANGTGNDVTVSSTTGNIVVNNVTATDVIKLTAVAGAIEEATPADAAADLTATTLDLDATDGIGTLGAIEVTATSIAADSSGTGNVNLNSLATAGVTATSLTAGTGNVTFNQTGGQTLAVTNSTTTDGSITITNADANLTATTVTAGGNGDVTLTTTTSGNVLLGTITATGNQITVTSAGSINDNLAGEGANLIANNAVLSASTGIGSADDIDTNLSQVQFTNSTSGTVAIQEIAGAGDNALEVLSGSNVTGNIDVRTTDGNLTISGTVSTTATGTVTLLAGDSDNDGNGDLAVNAAITAATGQVTLTSAGNDVTFSAAGDVTTTGGTIQVNSGTTGVGLITMNDGALFNAGSGLIDLNGVGNVSISQLVTTNATASAVTIDSTQGAILDAGDTDNGPGTADIIAMSGGVMMHAVTGIGTGANGAIEMQVSKVSADVSGADPNYGLFLLNDSAVTVMVTSLTTIRGEIRYEQTGLGELFFTGAISSGSPSDNGGNITLINNNAGLTVENFATPVSSQAGTGGVLTVSGAVINRSIVPGQGDITIIGNSPDLIVSVDITRNEKITLSARRDVIIRATVTATGADSDICVLADTDLDGIGGVWIDEAALTDAKLVAQRDVIMTGSDLFASPGSLDSIRIDSDGTNQQVVAGRHVDLSSRPDPTTPAGAEIILNGRQTATTGNVTIDAKDGIRIGDNGDITTTTGFIRLDGDANNDGTGDITMTDTARLDAGSGYIDLSAANVTLGELVTTSTNGVAATNPAVKVVATIGSISDAGSPAVNITATAAGAGTVLQAVTGIGAGNPLEIASTFVSADVSGAGDIYLTTNSLNDVTVTSLTSVGGDITFEMTGTGDLFFTGAISSGSTAPIVNGGDITLINFDGDLTVEAFATDVTSEAGTGGVLVINNATINRNIMLGQGNITIRGEGLDLVITVDMVRNETTILSAKRDVIILATVTVTGAGHDLIIIADSDLNGIGGFWLDESTSLAFQNASTRNAQLTADGNISITGSDLFADPRLFSPQIRPAALEGVLDSIRIDSDGTNQQIVAGGSLTLTSHVDPDVPAAAQIVINGRQTATTDATVNAKGGIQFGDDGDLTAATFVKLNGDMNDDGIGNITMADGALLDAGAGYLDLSAANVVLGGLLTTSTNSTTDTNPAVKVVATRGSITDSVGDELVNIVADGVGAGTVLRAVTGIGNGNAIETAIAQLDAQNLDRSPSALSAGNIEIHEVASGGDLELLIVHNQADGAATGDVNNGVIDITVDGGNLTVMDDGSIGWLAEFGATPPGTASAAVFSENTIRLTAENITIHDDIQALDDTAGAAGIDERIEINARGNFTLDAGRVVTTDDRYAGSMTNPQAKRDIRDTGDVIRIIADADTGLLSDISATDGEVFIGENGMLSTDAGLEQALVKRPDEMTNKTGTAFFEYDSIATSGLNFIGSGVGGSQYIAFLTIKVGVVGEQNLIIDIDWGDLSPLGVLNTSDPTVNANQQLAFNPLTDRLATRFVIPEGGREYKIPHLFTEKSLNVTDGQPGRTGPTDPFQVRFAVSQHFSIQVAGQSIYEHTATPTGTPIAVTPSAAGTVDGVVGPIGLLSSTDVRDLPVNPLPRFDNGVAAFQVPRNVVATMPRSDSAPPPVETPRVFLREEIPVAPPRVTTEIISSGAVSSSILTDEYYELRRFNEDGTMVVERLNQFSGELLLDQTKLEEFMQERGDGDYEIWFETKDPRDGAQIERRVMRFKFQDFHIVPSTTETPNLIPEQKLVPQPVNPPAADPPNQPQGANGVDELSAVGSPMDISDMLALLDDAEEAEHAEIGDATRPVIEQLHASDTAIESLPKPTDVTSDPETVFSHDAAIGLSLFAIGAWRRRRHSPTAIFSKSARLTRRCQRDS